MVKKVFGLVVVCSLLLTGCENVSDDGESKTKNKVTVTDFSSMTKAEVDTWCETNKVDCDIKDDYSDTVANGNFVSQSVDAERVIYENDKIVITYSLGKKPSTEQANALAKAESYSKYMNMSKANIYKQLTSEYGEGFSAEDAQYAIDNLVADYKANALAKAKSYQQNMNMSKSRIYDQLTSEYGEGFTAEEAQYAIDNLED